MYEIFDNVVMNNSKDSNIQDGFYNCVIDDISVSPAPFDKTKEQLTIKVKIADGIHKGTFLFISAVLPDEAEATNNKEAFDKKIKKLIAIASKLNKTPNITLKDFLNSDLPTLYNGNNALVEAKTLSFNGKSKQYYSIKSLIDKPTAYDPFSDDDPFTV